ncbi:MAG: 3-deoxy-manno-octulosonate cytidylyltransferase, partial [Fulvivirga sp.]|nr:3-deoxy-manno-octulosonate cytidylyltransferase [Fulvivirga sp.]
FPGKPLVDIGGKSMIQRVYDQASKCASLNKVIVATDHEKIATHVQAFGGSVSMTSDKHQSGTDRCEEILSNQNETFDYVVNIQGDEPFINPRQITELTQLLDGKTELATLIRKIDKQETLASFHVVKVIINKNNEAIYFSRSPLPFLRNAAQNNWVAQHQYYKHIGIYGYRADILKEVTSLPVSSLEKAEALEQLRWIENGYKIVTGFTVYETIGIDTPEDLEKVKDFY